MIHRVAKSQAQLEQFSTQYLKKKSLLIMHTEQKEGRNMMLGLFLITTRILVLVSRSRAWDEDLYARGTLWKGLLGEAGSGVVRGDASRTGSRSQQGCAKSLQSRLPLCDPVDGSPPGSSVHEIVQARTREWVALSSSRGSSQPRDRTHVSGLLHWQVGSLSTCWENPTRV